MPAHQPIILPEEALQLEPEQLADALKALSLADARIDAGGQEYIMVRLNPRTGKSRPVRAIDSTLSRILAALKGSFPDQEQPFFLSLCWRLAALAGLVRAGVLEEWVVPAGLGQTAVPDEVIAVAATLPLTGRFEFDPVSFLNALRALHTG